MKILALDCSTSACSVALLSLSSDGQQQVVQRFEMAARQHTQRLLPMVESLLAEHETRLSDVDAIGFGRGPGSFTGLRICIGAVQGLAYGADLPVVPVSTLAAQAQAYLSVGDKLNRSANRPMTLLSTLDARMDEVYWGTFQVSNDSLELIGQERLTAPENVVLDDQLDSDHCAVIGSGLAYQERLPAVDRYCSTMEDITPTAEAVAILAQREFMQGRSCSANDALPVYLRDEVAWQKQTPAA